MTDHEEKVYKAKWAEQAERYDEMVETMKAVPERGVVLNVENMNIL